MESFSNVTLLTNLRVKTKTKTKKILIDKIMETLKELKSDFLELKEVRTQ